VLTLSGHEDWIRSVAMIQDGVCAHVCMYILCNELSFPQDVGDILIASCGQDMFVRVWRLSKEQTKDSSIVDDELKVKKNSFTVFSQSEY